MITNPGRPCPDTGPWHHGQVTDRAQVSRWLAGYESAWRAPGTQDLAGLFTGDATYLQSPYEEPVAGATAVVRAEVHYGDPPHQEYRDLWVIHLDDQGRCTWFEEWPFWPGRPHAARDDHA